MSFPQIILIESYMEIIQPLLKWRILPLDKIVEEISYLGKKSNFYKKVSKLEKAGLLGSFINPATKKKEIYLLEKGYKSLGERNLAPITLDNLVHESVTSEIAFSMAKSPLIRAVTLEHDIINQYPEMQYRPDAILEGETNSTFLLALECELTQKSKKRVKEKYDFYNQSSYFHNVLYVFSVRRIYETYLEVLKDNAKTLRSDRYIFLYCPNLLQRDFNLFESEVTYQFSRTTLGSLFSTRGRK